jgi:hypothetical protein
MTDARNLECRPAGREAALHGGTARRLRLLDRRLCAGEHLARQLLRDGQVDRIRSEDLSAEIVLQPAVVEHLDQPHVRQEVHEREGELVQTLEESPVEEHEISGEEYVGPKSLDRESRGAFVRGDDLISIGAPTLERLVDAPGRDEESKRSFNRDRFGAGAITSVPAGEHLDGVPA